MNREPPGAERSSLENRLSFGHVSSNLTPSATEPAIFGLQALFSSSNHETKFSAPPIPEIIASAELSLEL